MVEECYAAVMKAISEDLRQRAVAAVILEGWSRLRAGEVYGISAVSVGRYVCAYQAGESLEPRQGGGRPRKLRLAEHVEALRESLQAEPDLELSERCAHLARSEGIHLSVPTLWRAVRALGWTRKKRR
jgi:transposase